MKRLLAIGDIHGQYEQLMTLLEMVKPNKDDKLITLGDMCDRGPDTPAVFDTLIALHEKYPHSVSLLGNHDFTLLSNYLHRHSFYRIFAGLTQQLYGGRKATLESYGGSLHDIPRKHIDWLRQLPLYHREDGFCFVHAGLRPEIPLEQQKGEDLMTIREPFLSSNYDFGFRVVHGHTVTKHGPAILPQRIGLDTGAVHSDEGLGKLTCMDVLSGEIWQA